VRPGRRNATAEQQQGRAPHDGLPGAASKQMWARCDGRSTIKLLRWWRIDAVRARADNGDGLGAAAAAAGECKGEGEGREMKMGARGVTGERWGG